MTDGVTLLKEWSTTGQLSMPVVMMSGHATIDTAVDATRIGAFAFRRDSRSLRDGFDRGLRELGYVEGRTIQLERRFAAE